MGNRIPRIQHLNWNLLRTFLVIVEERSITRAAERLLVRQPSITAALQKLEETLGCQLIQRDSRRFVLTSHGEMLRLECETMLRTVERIGRKLSADEDDLTGQVRLLTVSHLNVAEIDQALRQMRRRHPSVSVRIDVAQSQDIVRAVAQKQAPFGLCLLPKPLSTLECRFLAREKFGIFCGRTHPLYGRSDVEVEELKGEAFIAFTCSQEGGALEPMVDLREGAGLGSWTVGSSPHLEEVRRLILAGLGLGILPVEATQHVASENLWQIPALADKLGADVYFVRNASMAMSAAEQAFLELFEAELLPGGTSGSLPN